MKRAMESEMKEVQNASIQIWCYLIVGVRVGVGPKIEDAWGAFILEESECESDSCVFTLGSLKDQKENFCFRIHSKITALE